MGRGVSAGGGQSSLGYLFGSGEASKPAANEAKPALNDDQSVSKEPPAKPEAIQPVDVSKQIPAGIQSSAANNHVRADGQNTGNYISDRPSTKIHAAPGGGSSLGYLFGDGGN
ncbi:hypothetical protein LIER_41112 [Lithospermum erythrorhizon]|uniref:Protein SPIRAL1-like 1 n=1 Tax=Lithospermum erythrorhizon TaxID=34254 RepID=A0AAV3R6G7_LITER